MTRRIGIGVSTDSVCAVIAWDSAVEWSAVDVIEGDRLDTALQRLLGKLPNLSWPRPRVHAAVGPDQAYVKTIYALPTTRDARALGRIVAAAPNRFFVLPAGGATVTGVRVLQNGVVRAAIVGNDVIGLLEDACAAKGLSLARVVPNEIARSSLAEDDRLDACAFALAATLVDRREPIVVRSRRRHAAERSVGSARFALAAGVALIAVTAAMTIPTLDGQRRAARAHQEIAALAPARASTTTAERGLTEVSRMVATVSEFERTRTSVTWLLGQVVNALPPNAVIVSLRIDSAAITLSALADRATDVVRGIQDTPGAHSVEMIGAITYEGGAAGADATADPDAPAGRERVNIRFRLAPEPAHLRTPLATESGAKQ